MTNPPMRPPRLERVPPRLQALLDEYRSRHCTPECPQCKTVEGTMKCSQQAAWKALARIRARLAGS